MSRCFAGVGPSVALAIGAATVRLQSRVSSVLSRSNIIHNRSMICFSRVNVRDSLEFTL
jgi:hypothetical protein